MRMCGAFGKQQLKVCGERKSSWSPLTYSARFLKKPLGGDTRGLPGASATAGGPNTSCPLVSSKLYNTPKARNQYGYLTY